VEREAALVSAWVEEPAVASGAEWAAVRDAEQVPEEAAQVSDSVAVQGVGQEVARVAAEEESGAVVQDAEVAPAGRDAVDAEAATDSSLARKRDVHRPKLVRVRSCQGWVAIDAVANNCERRHSKECRAHKHWDFQGPCDGERRCCATDPN
jgi:hypothetical protein